MNFEEYAAKPLLKAAGILIPRGKIAGTADEAEAIAAELGASVIKAQVPTGKRGKSGGIALCQTQGEAREAALRILGMNIGEHTVRQILVEEQVPIAKEFYAAVLNDAASKGPLLLFSSEGGMDIEKVADETPNKIMTMSVDPATGLQPFHGRKIAHALGLKGGLAKQCSKMIGNLYRMFVEKDMSMLEINPLVVTKDDRLVCLDGKMNFDSNALYRHPDIVALRDETEEDPREIEASKHDLSYVKLDGTIGCMVNGAGLAMATMDIIKLHGLEPANFLDVGGGASKEKVQSAFQIILSDPAVQGILVNIFGGIMRCDIIAEGVVSAAREMDIAVPLVVRLEGTNVELGKKSWLKVVWRSSLPIISAMPQRRLPIKCERQPNGYSN